MSAYLYIVQNLIDGYVYVGVSDKDLHRLDEHKVGLKSNIHLQRAIRKYGIENFSFGQIEEWQTFERGLEAETEMIVYLRALGARLYNMNDGGMGGLNPTPELRARISANVKKALKNADMSFYSSPKYRETLSKAIVRSYTDELRQRRAAGTDAQWERWRIQQAMISPQRGYKVYRGAGDRARRRGDAFKASELYARAEQFKEMI